MQSPSNEDLSADEAVPKVNAASTDADTVSGVPRAVTYVCIKVVQPPAPPLSLIPGFPRAWLFHEEDAHHNPLLPRATPLRRASDIEKERTWLNLDSNPISERKLDLSESILFVSFQGGD